jgi:hypothetical protein
MAELADCTTYYWREMFLRMLFFNEKPPWEESPGYQWTPTEFRLQLHKTGDPGEAGSPTTTPADYTGYAGPIAVPRNTASWTLTGGGTANPKLNTAVEVGFGTATSVQTLHAVSIAIREGTTNHGIARDVLSSTFDTESGKYPALPSGSFEFRFR